MNKLALTVASAAFLLLLISGCQQISSWRRGAGDATKHSASAAREAAPVPSEQQKRSFKLEMAVLFEQQGEFEQALQAYRAVLEDEAHPIALHRMGVLLVKQGEIDEGIGYLQRALEIGNENTDVLCDMGYGLYLARRFDEAERVLRRAIELRPQLPCGHANLGMLLARTGRTEEALFAFSHAGLSEAEARNNLALAMMVNERFEEARAQYQEAVRIDPGCEPARNGLAALNQATQQQVTERPRANHVQQASYTTR